jgi:signal transduction histidine kinase
MLFFHANKSYLKCKFKKIFDIPLWQGNIMVFFVMFLMVVTYFFFQAASAQEAFLNDAKAHARLVADVVRLHAKGAILARDVTGEILKTFLGNTGRFIEYLDAVKAFSADELTTFARESGLAGIKIIRHDGSMTEGPAGWTRTKAIGCTETPTMSYDLSLHTLFYAARLGEPKRCVIAGVKTERIERLREEIGLPSVLKNIENIHGIRYVNIIGMKSIDAVSGMIVTPPQPAIVIINMADGPVAEVRMGLGGSATLVMGVDATPLDDLRRKLWRDFAVFSVMLALTCIFLSWLLYRWQLRYISKIKEYEKSLSSQREEAALGRAAASIAHEIRNPLNAIGIGLQRLKIEVQCLSEEHKGLLDVVLNALKRTNSIVTGLLRYSRPPAPRLRHVVLAKLLDDALALYQGRLDESGIQMKAVYNTNGDVNADPDLLGQVMENMIKNAVEAQRSGGFLDVVMDLEGEFVVFRMRNGGDIPDRDDLLRIFEPYFTTKTRGTGLGLAISNRIVAAHGGRMEAGMPEDGVIQLAVYLPAWNGA